MKSPLSKTVSLTIDTYEAAILMDALTLYGMEEYIVTIQEPNGDICTSAVIEPGIAEDLFLRLNNLVQE